eukprot:scaffold47146_cov16-Tisochrysis_lutea.AAC.1
MPFKLKKPACFQACGHSLPGQFCRRTHPGISTRWSGGCERGNRPWPPLSRRRGRLSTPGRMLLNCRKLPKQP